jgi:transcription initiation factor TFIIIB Brf1 subunit/transcription initiation factor TFIIB
MKCKYCGSKMQIVKDYNEAQGGIYCLGYVCNNCEIFIDDQEKK